MAAELIKRDRDRIEARVGRPLSTAEMYLAHFLGTASAGRFLSLSNEKPDETAAKAFRSAAKANRSLFTQKQGRKRRHLTIAEFQNRIEDMIDERPRPLPRRDRRRGRRRHRRFRPRPSPPRRAVSR